MKAFTNTSITKAELLKELRHHQKMDNFIKGSYEKDDDNGNFKGCAVGCSLESLSRAKGITVSFSNHKAYEEHFGVPAWLAKVEDRIFEGLPIDEAKKWPVQFTNAIQPGSDLNKIFRPYLILICESVLPHFDHVKYAAVEAGVTLVIKLLKNKKSTKEQFLEARKQCRAAADAYAADAAAADAAAAAYAAAAAAYAADAYAADAAAADAYAADAYAADAARLKFWVNLSKQVIKLIKDCK